MTLARMSCRHGLNRDSDLFAERAMTARWLIS